MKKGTTGLVKYDSVEQRQDVLEVMRKTKYQHRHYGKKVSLDALDHSISIEPVQEFFIYNENNEVIEQEVMEDSLNQEVTGALETLPMRESIILEMYFGINRDEELTLGEIGEEFDLTREQIRQKKERAIQRLRHRSRSQNLVRYI